jgi:NADH-quinone oxidoreductase subunit M
VLAIAVLCVGIYPKPLTEVLNMSVAGLLEHVAISKL